MLFVAANIDFETTQTYALTVRVSDGNLNSSATVDISVNDLPEAPRFVSTPTQRIAQGERYAYQVTTTDEDANTQLTILAIEKPGWLNFADLGNGQAELVGVPNNDDVGIYDIHLQVRDGDPAQGGLVANQYFEVRVTDVNDGPEITSVPPGIDNEAVVTVPEDSDYIYTVTATDLDAADTLTFSLENGPDWLTISEIEGAPRSALFKTAANRPNNDDLGTYDIVIAVRDMMVPMQDLIDRATLVVTTPMIDLNSLATNRMLMLAKTRCFHTRSKPAMLM